MGVAAPSFAAVAPHTTGSTATPQGTAVGVKTPLTVTITNPNIAGHPNTRTITWSLPAGAPAYTGTWSLNFHDASGSGTSIGKGTATGFTTNHDFVLGAGITYDTFSVSVSASDKVTGNTWSGTSSVTIGTPAVGGAVAPTITATPGLTLPVNTALTLTAVNGAVAPGGDLKYDFDFGDPLKTSNNTQVIVPGTDAAKTGTAQYSYTVAGTYKVAVTATDGTNKAVSTPLTITVTAAPGGGTPPPTGGSAVERIGGVDRFDTGVLLSKKAFPSGAKDVIIATGYAFPDALSGVPLAKKLNAPLLLVDGKVPANNAEVKAEIARVLATGGTLHILGGTSAVSTAVVNDLLPANVAQDRLGGATRFDTSVAIAGKLGNPKNVVVARGDDGVGMKGFADALSAGPYAANVFGGGNGAVLLSNDTTLDPAVKAYLAGATSIQAVGGPAATAVNGLANVQSAIVGLDRYDTAAQVAAKFPTMKTAGVAYGLKFPDALTGAAYLATADGPLVLTDTSALPPATAGQLQGIGAAVGTTGTIEVFGGIQVITEATRTAIAVAAKGHLVP
jgi:putative cell wall-binding protein